MVLEPLSYRLDGRSYVGQLARPAGDGPHPAVLIAHEIDGLGDNVRRRAAMLAELGYVALAADVYGDGRLEEGDAARALMMPLLDDRAELRRRIGAGLAALTAVSGVDPSRVAAIGYCFGGATVLELARGGGAVAGVVSFHGLLATPLPAEPGAIGTRILVAHGDADPLVPREQVAAFQQEMDRAGADWQLISYGRVLHAFTVPGVDERKAPGVVRHDPSADRQSWAAMQAFFAEVL